VGGKAHGHAEFVASRAAGRTRPGPIVDSGGAVLGEHDGVHRFTVGQRKGLGVAAGRPVFVTRIDAEAATVHVGDEASLAAGADLTQVVLGDRVTLPFRATVRVRYRHEGRPATVELGPAGGARVRFDAPVPAVTPGQIAVFYDGDRVLGGGRIERPLEIPRTASAS
jgi:tRNA-specific 2-thiouridylase